ncbi:MAG TPA: pyridoxamine 5'-phosphate oxidase family protein [Kofleriaceae bacterium]|nr:pyridoxamine 5'-phosphate oxidase family protein [Kofleriaceae bacterium]
MIEQLAPAQIEQLLHEQVIGRIGCHARGRTYVVPITYAYVDGAIVGHTGNGLKVRMMRENPSVCFEVEDLRHLPRWSSVIVHGHYEELHGTIADAALEQLVARLGSSPPAASSMPWEGAGVHEPTSHAQRPDVVFRIVIDEKTGRWER